MSKTARTNLILCILTVIVGIFAIFFAFRSDKMIKKTVSKMELEHPQFMYTD